MGKTAIIDIKDDDVIKWNMFIWKQYTILTGSKNNAGDFLIKYRAKQLFKELRPDRDIIDFNAWEEFDKEKLKIVNESKALILLGGPSLQKLMRPNIYKMTKNLMI